MSFESLYSGQFTSSTQLIKPNYLVILPTPNKKRMRLLVVSSLVVVASIWRVLSSRCKAFFPREPATLAVHGGIFENRGELGPIWKKMAGKTSPQDSTLLEITSEWFLDYCICQLWKEFKEKRSFSACWRDAIQGKVMGRHGTVFKRRLVRRSLCFTGFDKTLTPS